MGVNRSNYLGRGFSVFKKLVVASVFVLTFITARGIFVPTPKIHASSENVTELNAAIQSSASVTVSSSNVEMSLPATSEGAFLSNSVDATVSTNSTAGYELYMSSEDEGTEMVSTETDRTVSSDFAGTKTSETMTNNTWGYSLDNTNFSAIPTLSNQVLLQSYNSLPSEAQRTTTVSFGAKIDITLPTGEYTKTIVFSVVGHEPKIDLFDITYMQDMSAAVCQNTVTPSRYTAATTSVRQSSDDAIPVRTLIDRRDNRTYTVAKFADGQCWMTQNLAYSFSEESPATAAKTDLHSMATWMPTNGTSSTTGTWPSQIDVAEDRSYIEAGTGYYNWAAATAGHTIETASETTEDSICPRGWRLPTRNGARSFSNLLSVYSHVSTNDFFTGAMHLDAAGYYPFGSGHVDGKAGWTDSGGTSYPDGGQSWYWTATTSDSGTNQAYAFYAAKDGDKYPGIDTGRSTIKGHGLAVRCIAR